MKPYSSQLIHLPYYSEGPAKDCDGNIFCTTLSGGSILAFDELHNWKTWAEMDCPNGQCIDHHDDHLVCDSRKSVINRFNSQGGFVKTEIDGNCANETLQVPNDIISADGRIYFTDSVQENGKIFYIAANGSQFVIAKDLDYPNGLVLSADKRVLFVAESYKNRILSIPLHTDGTAVGKRSVFAELPSHPNGTGYNLPDGVALDKKGNLWIAHYGMQCIQVLSPQGKLIDTISVPFPLVSNLHIVCEDPFQIIVTGGFAEPGPGALFTISF